MEYHIIDIVDIQSLVFDIIQTMENQKTNLDNTENWHSMDFLNGNVQSYFALPNNQIHTKEHNTKFMVFLLVIYAIIRPVSLCLISSLIVIIVIPDSSPFKIEMYIVELVLLLFISIFKELYFDQIKENSDHSINKRVVRVCKDDTDNEKFPYIEWGQLKQGDIVYLEEGEVAPADIILLDSQQIEHREAMTYVDVRNINGSTVCQKKKSTYLTQILNRSSIQKRVWKNYRNVITGKLRFEKATGVIDDFVGYLKISKDPKLEKLSIDNLILRESSIKTSLWVYGLVVYAGMDSKIMRNFKESNKSRKWNISKTDYIFIFLLVVNLVLGTIFTLCYSLTEARTLSNEFIVAYHFLMFSVALPVFAYVAFDLFLVMFKFRSDHEKMEIRNYSNIQDLGEIDYALVKNVGIITTGRLQIDEIVTGSPIYKVNDEDPRPVEHERMKSSQFSQRKLGSSFSSLRGNQNLKLNRKNLLPIINVDKKNNPVFDQVNEGEDNFESDDHHTSKSRLSSIIQSKEAKQPNILEASILTKTRFHNDVVRGQKESTDIAKCMALCHQAIFKYDSGLDKYFSLCSINSEEVLLKLVSQVGWNISKISNETFDKKELGLFITAEKQKMNQFLGKIENEKKKTKFYWVGINSFHIERKLFSVVVSADDITTLYCKGRPEDIMERLKLSKETQKIIDSKLTSFRDKSEVIIYGKRELDYEEKQLYKTEYVGLKSSLTTTEAEIDEFSKKYERNLEFVCLIGMSIEAAPFADRFTRNICKSGIKMCMFGNERADVKLMKKLMIEDREVKEIKFEKESTEMVKYYLNEATSILHHQKNFEYVLILNGKTWKHITYSSELLQHFLFILHHSQGLITYGFEAEDIAEMAKRIRHGFPREQKILGIGYSYSDLKFLGESHIGIGLSKDLPADIKAEAIEKIEQIIELGPYLLETILSIINLVLYKTVTLTVIVLLYEIVLMSYSVSNTLEGNLVFFYIVIFNGLEIFYALIYHRDPRRLENRELYANYKAFEFKTYINLIEAAIHGAIIFLAIFFTLPHVRMRDGRILPIEAFHLAIFIVMISVGNFKKSFTSMFNKRLIILGTIITYILIAVCVFAASMLNENFKRVGQQFVYLFSHYDSIVMIVNTTIFCLAISLFINELSKKKLFSKVSEKANNENQSNAEFKDEELIQYLFKDEEKMESSLAELIAEELDANILKINRFLEIKNEEDRIKFSFQGFKKYQLTFTRSFLIMVVFQILLIFIKTFYIEGTFKNYIITLIIGTVFAFCVTIYGWRGNPEMNYYIFAEVCVIIMTIIFIIYCILQNITSHFLLTCFMVAFFGQLIEIRFFVLVVISCSIFLTNMILLEISSQGVFEKIFQTLIAIVVIAVNFILIFRYSTASKINFIVTENFLKEKNYVNDILSILVPKFIKNHLEENIVNHRLQQEENKVSILFCYVCYFDEMVKEEGTNVVLLMDELFRQFDELCHNYAVQKIQTVGMTYMASTGIKAYENEIQTEMKKRNQVERLLKMALQMIEKSKDIMWGTKKNKKIKIKIGIHSGNVVIGVIGYHKPQFSLIGDAVNTTSRHCSAAHPGQIVLSEVAFKMLKKFPISAFTTCKKPMKGLGEVNIYRYWSNELTEQKQLKIRLRFQKIVYKVIAQLKEENKIKYKKFNPTAFISNFIERNSEMRKSTRKQAIFIDHDKLDEVSSVREKPSEFELTYNCLLELERGNNQNKQKFKAFLIRKFAKTDRILLGIKLTTFITMLIIEMTVGRWNSITLTLKTIGVIFFPIMIALYKKAIKSKTINILITVFQVYLIAIMIGKEFILLSNSTTPMRYQVYFYPMLAIIICSCQVAFRFLHVLILSIIIFAMTTAYQAVNNKFEVEILFQFFYLVYILIRKYEMLSERYKTFSETLLYEKKTQEQSALVSQLLPKHAYEKLKNQNTENRLELTDKFENATMLFADIKGFTAYSNQTTPVGVVKMLRQLFEEFDKLCLKNNVYKVYTIGDCYVVLGFTNCYQRDYLEEAKNVVNMGIAMVDAIQKIREKLNFQELDMRIGIHTGTIIGGIIGTEVVRYDIYGPDVMIANKFEEFGIIGQIHISESTKEILEQDKKLSYNIVPNQNNKVKIEKLNAEYNGYLISKREFEF